MPLNNVLDATIAPVLILLKECDEAGTGNSGEPSSCDPLHGSTKQERWKVHTQCCSNDGHPTFDDTETCQSSAHGEGEVLGPCAGELNAKNTSDLHHHLGIDRGCTQQIHSW